MFKDPVKFELNKTEMKNLNKFVNKMLKTYRQEGSYVFTFYPTGIGYVVEAKRLESGETQDITDYDCW